LIIGLANYSKHKDDNRDLHSGTKEILESFGLTTNCESKLDNSPILSGLRILSNKFELHEVVKIVTNWRENLWLSNN
jgi:hypothetical protein